MPDNHLFPLYLFAKEPVAGQVKTRLASKLGHDDCAQLAEQMLRQSAEQVGEHWQGRWVLCVTPTVEAPLFRQMIDEHQCEIHLQRGQDLGDRLRHVLDAGVREAGACIVMGCDVPHISGDILRQAFEELTAGNNVIGPAEDGGFYLLGLQDAVQNLFDHVAWGESKVMERVMENAACSDRKFVMLPTLRDIDLWDDLVWLAQEQTQYASYIETASSPPNNNKY
ncbi:MAG: TIGR04282 family arsenosugar biosynthesis glycosyltransferase [Acidiferrobacterales bacterium]|nr:TIGR04282 family arsenosugar biosynthesis glycosyltransferase [Acidiferrobacterales bacterium]